MAKRGGASDINGFISIPAKKSTTSLKNKEAEKKKVLPSKSRNKLEQDNETSQKDLLKKSQKPRAAAQPTDRNSDIKHGKRPSDTVSAKDAHAVYIKKTNKGDDKSTVSKHKTTSVTSGRTTHKLASVPSLSSSPQLVNKKETSRKTNKLETNASKSTTDISRVRNEQKQTLKDSSKYKTATQSKDVKDSPTPLASKNRPSISSTSKSKQLSSSTSIKKKDKTEGKKSESVGSSHLLRRENTRTILKVPDQVKESSLATCNMTESKNQHDSQNTQNDDSLSMGACSIESSMSYDYEDDFEDYESDFEEYESEESRSEQKSETESELDSISDEVNQTTEVKKPVRVEEERKLDSGSYDLTSHVDSYRTKQIQDIKNAIMKENYNLNVRSVDADLMSTAEDEGYVESIIKDSPPLSALENGVQKFINFTVARKQQVQQKAKAAVLCRGKQLLSMIHLDVMHFSLLDLPSVPYEVYIKCYGRSNTIQVATQTNEENISEESQTDLIEQRTKWTQHPVKFSLQQSNSDVIETFTQEHHGVGGTETVERKPEEWKRVQVNSLKLHNFLTISSEVILILLEENEREKVSRLSCTKNNLPFSDGITELNVDDIKFLKGRSISSVYFSESTYTQIMTVHCPSAEDTLRKNKEHYDGRCTICVWSILEPSSPQKILVVSNVVTAACFYSYFIFTGLSDGSICVWDLREKREHHERTKHKQSHYLICSPTYVTAEIIKEGGHTGPVVSIKPLPLSSRITESQSHNDLTQIVSVEEDGLLIVWTVIECQGGLMTSDMGLAHWGKVRLVPSSCLNVLYCFPKEIRSSIQCTASVVDVMTPNRFYIGTNTGNVANCLQVSTRCSPQTYITNSDDSASVTCMEFSKCGHSLFMVGDSLGYVRIYRTFSEKPCLTIAATGALTGPSVVSVQWSPSRAGVFFVLDSDSCLHVWDLCSGDLFPLFSVPFNEHLTSISLAPHNICGYLAIATDAGKLMIHNLKPEFYYLPAQEEKKEKDLFDYYISII